MKKLRSDENTGNGLSCKIRKLIFTTFFIPALILLTLAGLFIYMLMSSNNIPEILAITPSVGYPGEILEIEGRYFGETRNGAEVIIAGSRPPTSSYLEWSESRVRVNIPDDAGSGKVFVRTREGVSKGVLFTNRNHIPVILQGPSNPREPYIEKIEPTQGTVGSKVTLRGMNFGAEQGRSRIFFSFFSEDGTDTGSADQILTNFIPCSELDFNYDTWSDREVTVFVPDGATSGSVFFETDRGRSNSVYFEVVNPVGIKSFSDSKGYQISHQVRIVGINASPGNSLDLWIPFLVHDLVQRNIEEVFEPEPFWKDYKGVMRFHLTDLEEESSINLTQTYWFDRYEVNTDINVSRVPLEYVNNQRLYRHYTRTDEYIPTEDRVIRETAARIVGRERNPYRKAELIYRHMINRISYDTEEVSLNPVESLQAGKADAFGFSVLFTALARSSGIPARPIAGFLVYGNKRTIRHFWSEIFIEGFGWMPVDPAMGTGKVMAEPVVEENPAIYYFGNLDSSHITFSRGITQIRPLDPNGTIVRLNRLYSLQTIHEEYSGNIDGYRSLWNDIQVIDWW